MTQSSCPVCGTFESYINHRHYCWEEDRRGKFYNFRVKGEKEKYINTLCESCRKGDHDCLAGRKCYCPYYGCSIERKSKLKWDLKRTKTQLNHANQDIIDAKQRIKEYNVSLKEMEKALKRRVT